MERSIAVGSLGLPPAYPNDFCRSHYWSNCSGRRIVSAYCEPRDPTVESFSHNLVRTAPQNTYCADRARGKRLAVSSALMCTRVTRGAERDQVLLGAVTQVQPRLWPHRTRPWRSEERRVGKDCRSPPS